jgi:pimeloyl-ACP methyl ester carboxylesterase
MPAVFVHGVPDTHRVWQHVVSHLDRSDVVTLSLPGFDSPLPEGFLATKEAYADWLLEQLNALPKPLDLVGHDWGAILVLRAVSVQPDLARSWAVGGAPIDSKYVWHQAAQMWQTPEVGEQVMQAMTPAAIQSALIEGGVPSAYAAETAKHIDDTMKDCILKLYRSAIKVGIEWEKDLEHIAAPGLVLWGEKDPYVSPTFGLYLSVLTRSKFFSFLDFGHWWQLQRPAEVAAELRKLWNPSEADWLMS